MSAHRVRLAQPLPKYQRPMFSQLYLRRSKPHQTQNLFARVHCTQSTWRTPSSQDEWYRKGQGALTTQRLSKDETGTQCNRVGRRLGSSKLKSCLHTTTTIREGMLETIYTPQEAKIFNNSSKHGVSLLLSKIQKNKPSLLSRRNWKQKISDNHKLLKKLQIISQKSAFQQWNNPLVGTVQL